jgi:hypothetical protein
MRNAIIGLIALLGLGLTVVSLRYGTVEPCGILRQTAREQDRFFAVMPDALLNLGLSSALGPLTPWRCLTALVDFKPVEPPKAASVPPRPVTPPARPAPANLPPPSLPRPAKEGDEPNCTAGVIRREEGAFLPGTGLQLLTIEQQQKTDKGGDPFCNHRITISRLGQDASVIWEESYLSAGTVFSNGYWHPQSGSYSVKVDAVRLLPPPNENLQQLLIYDWGAGANAGRSSAKIVTFMNDRGAAKTLLSVNQHGQMEIFVDGKSLVINGYYIAPNQCNACGENRSLRLRFNQQVQQFEIENPDQKAVEFYRYLTKSGRG